MAFVITVPGSKLSFPVTHKDVVDVDLYVARLRTSTDLVIMVQDGDSEPEPYDVWRRRIEGPPPDGTRVDLSELLARG